jgi:transposase
MSQTRYIGLDVHKAKIAVAVAEEGRTGDVRSYGSIDNTPAALAKLLRKLSTAGPTLHLCYEAGGCGYGVYRQIVAAGHRCDVVAPSRIPKPTGDRVKTDRRDAVMLAKLLRAGELTSVWVPEPAHEAMRDLIRSRGAAMAQRQVARQQLQAFLLRHGRIYQGIKTWGPVYYRWLGDQKFDLPAHQAVMQDYINAVLDAEDRVKERDRQITELIPQWSMQPVIEALCTMRGVSTIIAASVLASTGDLARFPSPRQLMAYFGLVPSERSSGGTVRRGGITKTGNGEVRRVLTQAAWCYRFPARVPRRQVDTYCNGLPAVRQLAWKCQLRLTKRYRVLAAKGKPIQVVVTAIARELLAFMWAIGQVVPPTNA